MQSRQNKSTRLLISCVDEHYECHRLARSWAVGMVDSGMQTMHHMWLDNSWWGLQVLLFVPLGGSPTTSSGISALDCGGAAGVVVTRAGERGSGGALLHNSEVLPAQDEKKRAVSHVPPLDIRCQCGWTCIFVSSDQQPLMRKAEKPFDGDITQSPACILLTFYLLVHTSAARLVG